ncbi:MAG: hypothetical protein ACE37N_00075 [Pseudohongiellaceae bacterium]
MKSFLKRSTLQTAVFLAVLALLPWSVASAQQVLEQQRNRPIAVQTLVGTVDGKAEMMATSISGTNYGFNWKSPRFICATIWSARVSSTRDCPYASVLMHRQHDSY